MVGFTDYPFRRMAKRFGASLVYSEMVSANAALYGGEKTMRMLLMESSEHPIGVQIMSGDPDVLKNAAAFLNQSEFDLLDINCGCSVRKIVKSSGGVVLMKDADRFYRLARGVVMETDKPVTCKIRLGLDEKHMNYLEVASAAESAGVRMLTCHARTASMKFSGRARDHYSHIRNIATAIKIPVIGNGDVRSGEEAARLFRETGCAAIMIGRAALGRPWIFSEIRAYLSGDEYEGPEPVARVGILLDHMETALAFKGERAARELKKHIAVYLKGLPGNAEIKNAVFRMETSGEILDAIRAYQKQLGSLVSSDRHLRAPELETDLPD